MRIRIWLLVPALFSFLYFAAALVERPLRADCSKSTEELDKEGFKDVWKDYKSGKLDSDCIGLELSDLSLGLLEGKKADPDDLPSLLEACKEKSSVTRSLAVGCLGSFKDPQAMAELLQALSGDPNPGVRAVAAESLGATGDPAAIPALRKARKDKSSEVRKMAAKALSRLKAAK